MSIKSVITLTSGPAGCGKTYTRCPHFLIHQWLPFNDGDHWSNFPVFPDKIIDEAVKRHRKDRSLFEGRIKTIPKEELDRWERGESGPWDFFRDINIQGAHIAIDEIHNFCPNTARFGITAGERLQKWQEWLGEIRHRGCTVEFITQSEGKMPKALRDEAETKISVINSESERDRTFGILYGDWYELQAKITGKYKTEIWEIEERREGAKWVKKDIRYITRDPYYFQFYDSYSTPQKGGLKGEAQKHPYEKYNWFRLIVWFCCRNPMRVFSRVVFFAFIVWMMCGGVSTILTGFNGFVGKVGRYGTSKVAAASVHEKPGTGVENKSLSGRKTETGTVENSTSSSVVMANNQRVRELEKQVEELILQKNELIQEMQKLSAVVLITEKEITLSNGYRYEIGEVIDWGMYRGKKIKNIDWRRRCVLFSDGTLCRMGNYSLERVRPVAEQIAGGKAGVSGSLPKADRKGWTVGETGKPVGKDVDDNNAGNASCDVSAVDQR